MMMHVTEKLSYRRFAVFNLVVLAVSGLVFTWIARDGRIDFWLARQFFNPTINAFPLKNAPLLVTFGHSFLKNITALSLIVAILLAGASLKMPRLFVWRRALITFCVMAGCSALAISALKSASVHACPWDLAMYGGDAQWFALFDKVTAGAVPGHCWPGGHASGGFAVVAGYFALREQRPRWAQGFLITGLALGTVMGAVQMARGAHFLSHNLWTLWVVWAICFGLDTAFRIALRLPQKNRSLRNSLKPAR